MKLSAEQIRQVATGTVRIEEENGIVKLYRFTKEQEQLYRAANDRFYGLTFSTAGIRLWFKTDSKTLFLSVVTSETSSRRYFSFDIRVNGRPLDYLDNFSDSPLPNNYTQAEFALGDFSKTFLLGDGVKTVCVYFPWSVCAAVREISVDDGAFVEAVRPEKKLLVYGDSITQGFDALRPSERYAARLADSLGAEEINKAIGGEGFFPALAECADAFVPDYITVAYGTNDWSSVDEENFCQRCKDFYAAVRRNYPTARIFAITPIWRKDYKDEVKCGAFDRLEEKIADAVSALDGVTVIPGFDFVPGDEAYFADLRLHPNDKGFDCYFESLYSKIKAAL